MEWLIIGIFIISVIRLIWLKISNQKSVKPSFGNELYKAKALLTENEHEFLLRLEKAVPELRFHVQVAMGALINPTVSPYYQKRDYYRLRSQFSQKIVDFVAQNRVNGQIVAVIELDDRTHNSEKDALRDMMLIQAGYRVVRWHSRNKPDSDTIRRELWLTD